MNFNYHGMTYDLNPIDAMGKDAERSQPMTIERVENAIVMRELQLVCQNNNRSCKEWYGDSLRFLAELQTQQSVLDSREIMESL